MEQKARKLLVRPDPRSDESLLGYLLRLTEANAYDSLGVILSLSNLMNGKHWWVSRNSPISTGKVDLTPLAKVIDKAPETLSHLIYQLVSTGPEALHKVGQAYVPAGLLSFHNPGVCAKCLTEDIFHRRLWDIAPYTACHKHGIELNDICAACGKKLNWARPSIAKCRCTADLTTMRPLLVNEHALVVSKMVAECVDSGVISNHLLVKDMASLRAVLHIGYMLTKKRPWSDADLGVGHRTYHQRHEEVVQAFAPFVQWPQSFHTFLREFIGVERTKFSSLSTSALLHHLDMALDRFPYKDEQPEIYQAIRQELNAFLTSENVRAIPPDRLPSNQEGLGRIRSGLAADFLDVSPHSFSSLAKHHLSSPQADDSYSMQEIGALKEILDRLVTIQEAGKILGISPHHIQLLLRANIIKAFRGPEFDGYRDILIDAKVLDQFLAKLSTRADLFKGKNRDGITISDFLKKHHKFTTKRLPEVVQATLDGILTVVGFNQELGLAGVSFGRTSFLRFIGAEVPNRDALLTIDDLMRELNLYKDAIYRLMASGLISYHKRKINIRTPQRYVNKTELADFRKEYILPREIAAKHGLNVTNLAERLMQAGVTPVSGPFIDNGLVYVFRRSHVNQIDLQALLAKDVAYPTRTGRPKKGEQSLRTTAKNIYLDAHAVGEILGGGVSVQKVSRLVKGGFLRPVEHTGELGNKRYFTREEVQRYLTAYRDNPDLLRLDDVLVWLDLPENRLVVDWIRPSRLKLIEDGLGGRYAKREDLKRIKAFRIHAVSTRELADLVGKTRHDIGNAIRLGKLSAISGPGIDEFSNYMFDREAGVLALLFTDNKVSS